MSDEATIVRAVADRLRAESWEVYFEVGGASEPRADIVATRGPVALVVEAKQSLSLAVIEQAMAWRARANLVAVATWAAAPYNREKCRRGSRREFPERLLGTLGIGLYAVNRPYNEGDPASVHFEREARWNRHKGRAPIFEHLRDGMKDVAPGARKGYWSEFRETVSRLVEFVRAHPGCSMKQAISGFDHHYANDKSAVACLGNMLWKGVIDEIEDRDGGLYVKPGAAKESA